MPKSKVFKAIAIFGLIFLSSSNLTQALTMQEIIAGQSGRVLATSTVAFVSESHSAGTASSATTPSIAVSGTNPVLVVATVVDGTTGVTNSVSFSGGGNAVLISSVRQGGAGGDGYADIWCIAAPPAVTGTVTANFSSSQNYDLDAMLFTGADQTNPCPSANAVSTQSTNGTSLTLTPTGLQTGDMSVGNSGDYQSGDALSLTPNQAYLDTAHNVDMVTGYAAATAGLTANFISGSAFQTFVAIRIQQAGSSGPTTPTINSFTASPTSISSGNSSTLSWNISNATSASINGGVGTVSATSATTNVSPTVTTTYTLTATNAQGSVTYPATVTVTVPDTTPPSTPTNLSVTAVSSSAVNLSWTASTDNVGVTGYKIYRGGTQVGISATNSYSDTGLSAGTNYSYTVSAYDAAGNNSSQSTSASATTQAPDTTPPSTPTGLSATAVSSSGVNLSWTASTDNVGVTGYKIYRGGTQIGTSGTNSYSDSGLSASTQYTYTVSAYDAANNNSSQSSSASATTQAQQAQGTYPWSNIIDSSRAIDWSQSGVVGGVPSASWANCVTSQCNTVFSGTVTAASVQAAINSAPNNTVVRVPAGSFSLSSFLVMKSNVALRGAGASQTTLTFAAGAYGGGCFLGGATICFTADGSTYNNSSDSGPGASNAANWTAGFSQGATSITLTTVGSTGIFNGQYIYLDQANDTTIGNSVFNCDSTTCSTEGGSPGRIINGVGHSQLQIVKVVSGCSTLCAGAGPFTVTITPGLYGTNWSSGRTPGAWFPTVALTNAGVENLTINNQTGMGDNGSNIGFMNAFNDWVSGVSSLHGGRAHIWLVDAGHITMQNSYFYQTQDSASQSYGIEEDLATDNLVVNNIFQQVTTPLMSGSQFGDSFAYNYGTNDYQTASANCMYTTYDSTHDAAAQFNLYEGNVGESWEADVVHGTAGLNTAFRNFLTGYELGKSCSTISLVIDPYNRAENILGNVFGTPGITTTYEINDGFGNGGVYALGQTHASVGFDSVVKSTLLRWGNYDNVTGAVRWCGSSIDTGWSTTCAGASEVPTGISPYANAVPSYGDTGSGQGAMPPSFIYSAKPSWWPSAKPWPPIGPEVANGNIGQCINGSYSRLMGTAASQCTGGTFAAQVDAGHAYSIPAQDCYFSLGGPPDGSGGALNFDSSSCYTTSGGGGTDTQAPSTPTNLSATAVSSSAINLSWTASTDNVGVTGYKIFRAGTQIGTSGTNSYSDTGLTAGTNYSYTVSAYDAAGNNSAQSSSASATTQSAPDTTAPTAAITSPSAGTVSGTITFSATASDPTITGQVTSGLKTLTLYVDGSMFATSTTGTVSKSLDTTTLSNGSHSLTATALDNAGNSFTTAAVSITVNNASATKYPRTISLTSLEGISAIPSNTAITATVLSPSSGSTLETQTNLSATAGKYTVTFLSSDPQLVNIRVKVNGYLSQLLTNIDTTVNSAVALSVPQLSAGDFNNDNAVNSLDYSLMNSHWLQNYLTADINQDSIVNSIDFAVLKNNWNKAGQ